MSKTGWHSFTAEVTKEEYEQAQGRKVSQKEFESEMYDLQEYVEHFIEDLINRKKENK